MTIHFCVSIDDTNSREGRHGLNQHLLYISSGSYHGVLAREVHCLCSTLTARICHSEILWKYATLRPLVDMETTYELLTAVP